MLELSIDKLLPKETLPYNSWVKVSKFKKSSFVNHHANLTVHIKECLNTNTDASLPKIVSDDNNKV